MTKQELLFSICHFYQLKDMPLVSLQDNQESFSSTQLPAACYHPRRGFCRAPGTIQLCGAFLQDQEEPGPVLRDHEVQYQHTQLLPALMRQIR